MANIKPFRCIRPARDKAARIAALPYDVYDRKEACAEADREPLSFLRVDRPEIQFSESVDPYDPRVYQAAHDTLWQMVEQGDYIKEQKPSFYLYELTMDGRVQDGLVACVSLEDYVKGVVKRHENTREEKEQDRIRHVTACKAQTGPIFLAYRRQDEVSRIIAQTKEQAPLYDFQSPDGVRHRVFGIFGQQEIDRLQNCFAGISSIYIADGHHRAASAVKVGQAQEECQGILSVLFADEQLKIMDYNRVVRDLGGDTPEGLLQKMSEFFVVTPLGQEDPRPRAKGEFSMFLADQWYRCQIPSELISTDPVESLDVSILQDRVLAPILGITDPRVDHRIDFVGGIRGLEELERRVREDCAVAFAMYPTSIGELFDVADAGRLMPPKSTWFEPKLRSGLFINEI